MTIQIALVFTILGAALVLFITERVRVDLVGLLVLGSLAVTGLVTTEAAFSGFSNPAVITVWAMFIISEGLSNTGIASRLGSLLMKWAGEGEARLVGIITAMAAVMSAFMNNIGVAALMLPVTLNICNTTKIAPSRLLMPMVFGSLLGGLTTMIGTPPNLLVSAMMSQFGFEPFSLFDFSLMGVPILLAGIVFFQFAGRHLLPKRFPGREMTRGAGGDLQWRYGLEESTFLLSIPAGSRLAGKTIAESRLATSAGVKVIATLRDGEANLIPSSSTRLEAGQKLLVQGRLDRLNRLRNWSELIVSGESSVLGDLVSRDVLLFEVRVAEASAMKGTAPNAAAFRDTYHGNLLAVRRGDQFWRGRFSEVRLDAGDRLLVQGGRECLDMLEKSPNFDECFTVDENLLLVAYELPRQVFVIRVPANSALVGATLEDSGIGELFEFSLLGLFRDGALEIVPDPERVIEAEDRLLVHGSEDQVDVLRALQEFVVLSSKSADLGVLESEETALIEATLAPGSGLAGQTVSEIEFDDRFGLDLMAIWRKGRAYRTDLGSMQLNSGDALLLLGPRNKLRQFEEEPDFLVLTPLTHQIEQTDKAPVAAIILGCALFAVLVGWLHIAVAAVSGAALLVLTKCLTMEEAYRSIEWKAIFLIAGMLPLGIALDSSGAAAFLVHSLLDTIGDAGPFAVVFALYALTALATLFVPTAALVVLMGPIVITASANLGVHPQTGMMAIAVAASASFASPVSHPANLMVMGPGGYRFIDYMKLGLPLTLLVGLVTAVLLPLIWPLKTAAG